MSKKHYSLTVNKPITKSKARQVKDLDIGEVGLVTYKGKQHYILRAFGDTVVSLTDPSHTWSGGCSLLLIPLPENLKITLTINN